MARGCGRRDFRRLVHAGADPLFRSRRGYGAPDHRSVSGFRSAQGGAISLDPSQFKALVIRPILAALNRGGTAAENLLLGTALTESNLVYLHQLGAGPALGVYQMEPNTHDDLWTNFLAFRQELSNRIKVFISAQPTHDQLVTNLAYATAMCRVQYYRAPAPLPGANDAAAMAAYWKQFYNTTSGAGNAAVATSNFQKAIAA